VRDDRKFALRQIQNPNEVQTNKKEEINFFVNLNLKANHWGYPDEKKEIIFAFFSEFYFIFVA
jgi:hypothetical protein